MTDLTVKFSKKFSIIKVVFDEPSTSEIIDGLYEASEWELQRLGSRYLAEFPFDFSLERALKFRVLKCKGSASDSIDDRERRGLYRSLRPPHCGCYSMASPFIFGRGRGLKTSLLIWVSSGDR